MKHFAALAALPLAAVLLTSCSGEDADDKVGRDPQAAPPTITADQVCPDQLAEASETHGFGGNKPASGTPELGEPVAVWVCTYNTIEIGDTPSGGTKFGWKRMGEATEVSGTAYDVLARGLTGLVPADGERACTADLGPRVLVGHVSTDGGLTAAVVDLFGCRDVRLTPDPASVAPGESEDDRVPAGVLTGTEEFVQAAAAQSALNE